MNEDIWSNGLTKKTAKKRDGVKKLMSYIEGDSLIKQIEKSLERHDQEESEKLELLSKPTHPGDEEVDGFIKEIGGFEDDDESRSNIGGILCGAITDTEFDQPSSA